MSPFGRFLAALVIGRGCLRAGAWKFRYHWLGQRSLKTEKPIRNLRDHALSLHFVVPLSFRLVTSWLPRPSSFFDFTVFRAPVPLLLRAFRFLTPSRFRFTSLFPCVLSSSLSPFFTSFVSLCCSLFHFFVSSRKRKSQAAT